MGKTQGAVFLDLDLVPIPARGIQQRTFPPLLRGDPGVTLWTVSLEALLASKIEGMLRRGRANTRYKDYWDVARLAETADYQGDLLTHALQDECALYGTPFLPNEVFLDAGFPFDPVQSTAWAQQLQNRFGRHVPPEPFHEVIARIRGFALPILQGRARGHVWSHALQQWG